MSYASQPQLFLTITTIVVIVFAIVITALVQGSPEPAFSQIITVGPVWTTDTWSCTSDADFIVHGTIRSIGDAQLAIGVSGLGTQSLYTFVPSNLYSFTIGGPADHTMTLTRVGTVTGWITLQTVSGATASCNPV
jgi:hypothetical protein